MIRFVFFLLLSGWVFFSTAQIPGSIPPNQLVAYWPLNGNVSNVMGTLHNGTATNAISTTDRFGNINGAFQLTGTNSYLTLPVSVMSQVGSSPFTVSIWVSPDTNIALTNGMEIISDKTSGSWLHKFRIAVGAIAFGYSPDSTYWDAIVGSNVVPKVSGPGLTNEGWWHLVFVYENVQGGRFTAYRNGVMVGQTVNTSTSSGARQINVGRAIWPGAPANGSFFFKGKVDDIGIWNRALTAAEVLNVFTSCNLTVNMTTPIQTVVAGGTTQFSVSTTATNPSYQWQVDSTNSSVFFPLTNGGSFSGVDSNVLLVNQVNFGMSGWKFRCSVGDTLCSTVSVSGELNVNCNLSISTPASTAVLPGDSAVFSVGAARTNHTYQWQILQGNNWSNITDFGPFSGTATSRLVVRNIGNTNHNQQFRCLTQAFGCSDTSQAATLSVLCLVRNLNGPTNAPVVEGQTAIFRVDSLVGSNYTWQRNVGFGFQSLTNGGNIQGVNQPTLRISNVQWSDNLSGYRCIVRKDHCADTSGAAILQVVGGVSVQEQQLESWTMYPNPAKDEVILERSSNQLTSMLNVRNSLGQLVLQLEVSELQIKLQTTGWPEGMYLIEWEGRTQRLLIQR